jgi:ubiquinone/menaquinone biosynthesis C-methylase UbiE
MSETAKHRHLVLDFCLGNGIDIGCGIDPVVPWAIAFDLPPKDYEKYAKRDARHLNWRGDCRQLPLFNETANWIHASHVLEDFAEWRPVLEEWSRVLKVGGYLMIAVPDHIRFRAAVANGQGDNLSHKHESHVGELTHYLANDFHILREGFVSDSPHEYSILFIGRKKSR